MIEIPNGKDKVAALPSRRLIQISGDERVSFLQGLITNDVQSLEQGSARFSALLTPQGKILFDFLVVNAGDVFVLDCADTAAPDLAKRLGMYKLRAKIAIEDVSGNWRVAAAWGPGAAAIADGAATLAYPDPRFDGLGWRMLLGELDSLPSLNGDGSTEADYEAHRIACAVPECGKDYPASDAFPHEACLDLLRGVDFKKGCYVGQEVVSRMHHRGTARTRVVAVTGENELSADRPELKVNGFPIGRLGSVSGHAGIALARLDRVAEALAKGQAIEANGIPVSLAVPQWADYALRLSGEDAR